MKLLPLTGKGLGKFAMVDDEDFENLSGHSWCLTPRGICSSFKNKQKRLNRVILNATDKEKILNKNGNILDCRKENLIIRNKSEVIKTDSRVEIHFYDGTISFTDLEFFDLVSKYDWYLKNRVKKGKIYQRYVVRNICSGEKRTDIYLHRIIANTPDGLYTDHVDGNTLNNHKNNLRVCTIQENSFNCKKWDKKTASSYKGVKFKYKLWEVNINYNRERFYLGAFETQEEAAAIYNKAAKLLFNSFAKLNDVDDIPFATTRRGKKIDEEYLKTILPINK